MKNSKYVIIILSFVLAFISCSNNQTALITYVEEDTLKLNIKEKGENIIWTKEIEGNILTENIKKNDSVLNNSLSPTIMNVMSSQYESIYPYFDNFGNLDTRNLSMDVKTFVNDFCKEISENVYSINTSYLKSDFIFTYVFFIEELEKNWNKYFHTEFPVKKNEILDKKTNLSTDDNDLLSADDNKKYNLFTSWIFGEPFNSTDYIQLPIRMFCKSGSIDLVLYLTNSTPFGIFNIEIKNWEGTYVK